MNIRSLLCLWLFLGAGVAQATVILTPGRIEVHATLEGDQFMGTSIGETLDYLTFEVPVRTSVRLIATDISGPLFLALGQVVANNEFDWPGDPYRLFYNAMPNSPPEFTRFLDPGVYVVQVAVEEYDDLAPTFLPVVNTAEIISTVSYSFALEGDVRGLEFLEGNRDRTFTVTQVPEPSVAVLLGVALAASALLRRRR